MVIKVDPSIVAATWSIPGSEKSTHPLFSSFHRFAIFICLRDRPPGRPPIFTTGIGIGPIGICVRNDPNFILISIADGSAAAVVTDAVTAPRMWTAVAWWRRIR